MKYKTILVAYMYMNIFQIIEPLSRWLQTVKLYILKCQQMVTGAIEELLTITYNQCK